MKNLTLLAFILVLFASLSALAAADTAVSNGQVVVNVQGQSGKITFYLSEVSSKQYTLTFSSLCETNGGDCLNTFANQQFTFSPVQNVKFQNISAALVTFSSIINTKNQAGVKFDADLYVFEGNGQYSVGGQTFYAANNTFKWSFSITGWSFKNSANKLQLTMGLLHPSYKAQWDATNYTLSYPGEGTIIQFANTATYDKSTQGPVQVDSSVTGSNVNIVFSFNSATNSIWYDPQVTMNTSPSSASSLRSSIFRTLSQLW